MELNISILNDILCIKQIYFIFLLIYNVYWKIIKELKDYPFIHSYFVRTVGGKNQPVK